MSNQIKERKLEVRTRIWGPRHDPWGVEEFVFTENGEETKLTFGVDVQLHHKGQVRRWDHECEEMNEAFREATGLTPNEFWEAHNRTHQGIQTGADNLFYGGA